MVDSSAFFQSSQDRVALPRSPSVTDMDKDTCKPDLGKGRPAVTFDFK